jgi:hypothetical protein
MSTQKNNLAVWFGETGYWKETAIRVLPSFAIIKMKAKKLASNCISP